MLEHVERTVRQVRRNAGAVILYWLYGRRLWACWLDYENIVPYVVTSLIALSRQLAPALGPQVEGMMFRPRNKELAAKTAEVSTYKRNLSEKKQIQKAVRFRVVPSGQDIRC